MTSKIYSAILAGTAVLAVTLGSTSAQAATASADARARILSALTLTNTADLEFGAIVVSGVASTVAISPAGLRTCGANLSCSGTFNAASFDITTGTAGETVDISHDGPIQLSNGTDTMDVALALSSATVILDVNGEGTVTVGGTLDVAGNQPEGVYTGIFNVTADYQ